MAKRALTKAQKAILDKYDVFDIDEVEGLEKQLAQINDYETMWSDANRYLSDKKSKTHNFMSW